MENKKTLIIHQPYLSIVNDNTVRLCSDIEYNGKSNHIWYETDRKWEKYLCYERADAFLVNILLFAMEHNADVHCDCDISERLYYQLSEYLIPSISTNIEKYHSISITGNLSAERFVSANACGTGVSGGVDSMYTIFRHIDRNDQHNLTHLVFCNAGTNGDFGGEDARETYKERGAYLMQFAEKLHLPMISVDTNINEFLNQLQEQTHTFRTLSTALVFQKLFSVYYYGSGYPFSEFAFSVKSPAHYDLFNMICIATENITFYSSGGETTRLGKLRLISNYDLPKEYLNVCITGGIPNCCYCEKCRRTIMGLYALGRLDEYGAVFDVEKIKKNKFKHKCFTYFHRKATDWPEIYSLLRKSKEITRTNIITYYLYLLFSLPGVIICKLKTHMPLWQAANHVVYNS